MFINGKKKNYAVDLTEIIKIDWIEHDISQSSYEITIYRGKEEVFRKFEETNQAFCYVDLHTHVGERASFNVVVTINQNQELNSQFYSANLSLGDNQWVTRLDNPIEKEQVYYQKRPGYLFKQEFDVEKKEEDLLLDIAGLGYYDVFINGKRVNDYYLNSDVTNYAKVVYYDTFKINDFVVVGKNEIEIQLGNGWYNPAPLKLLGKYNMRQRLSVGKPMFLCQLTQYSSDSSTQQILSSSHTWQAGYTNLVFDNIYVGEERVANLTEKNLKNYSEKDLNLQTVYVSGPGGELRPSRIEKVKRQQAIDPVKIHVLTDGCLIDFGTILSGQLHLTVDSIEQKVTLYYAETLNEDGTLDFSTTTTSTYGVDDTELAIKETDDVIQKDVLYANHGQNIFENQFTYHSFRYVKVVAEQPTSVSLTEAKAFPVHTNLRTVTQFESSSLHLNQLFAASLHTKKNNIHSYYEDCARERLGYGGDIVALLESQILSFDSENLLMKVLDDFINDQTVHGGIPQTAPYMGIQTFGPSDRAGSLGWQMVLSEIVIKYLKYYDSRILTEKVLVSLKRHLNYLMSYDYEYIKSCCLGDWGSVDTKIINGKETPPDKEFCSAAMYVIVLNN